MYLLLGFVELEVEVNYAQLDRHNAKNDGVRTVLVD